MDDVADLVRRFADLVDGPYDVVDVDAAQPGVLLGDGGVERRLHLPRDVLADLLAEVAQPGGHPWDDGVSVVEAAARLMAVHLDESLATREQHESGWWTYDGGLFVPLPPWEQWRRATRRR